MKMSDFKTIEFIDNDFYLDVRVDEYGMVWLSQKEIAKLYGISAEGIRQRVVDIFKRGELDNSVAKESLVTASDGKRYKTMLYNYEMIIIIGYKLNSKRTSIFKKWYEDIIKWDKSNNNLVKNDLQIVKFTDSGLNIDVSVDPDRETVWLTQDEIALLYDRERTVISKHISNIFNENEVNQKSNVQKMHIPFSDKSVMFYSLDVVLAVGYRVNSKRGIMFRQWANNTLKNYLIKGYSINEARCLECSSGYRMLSLAYEDLKNKYERIEKRMFGEDIELISENDVPQGIISIDRILNQAKNKIIIIDKYADEFLLKLLAKCQKNIIIITSKNYLDNLSLKSNIKVIKNNNLHSRYILIDDEKTYTITHSFNGIGLNEFEIIFLKEIKPQIILNEIKAN